MPLRRQLLHSRKCSIMLTCRDCLTTLFQPPFNPLDPPFLGGKGRFTNRPYKDTLRLPAGSIPHLF
jgi:hypothetical protein